MAAYVAGIPFDRQLRGAVDPMCPCPRRTVDFSVDVFFHRRLFIHALPNPTDSVAHRGAAQGGANRQDVIKQRLPAA